MSFKNKYLKYKYKYLYLKGGSTSTVDKDREKFDEDSPNPYHNIMWGAPNAWILPFTPNEQQKEAHKYIDNYVKKEFGQSLAEFHEFLKNIDKYPEHHWRVQNPMIIGNYVVRSIQEMENGKMISKLMARLKTDKDISGTLHLPDMSAYVWIN